MTCTRVATALTGQWSPLNRLYKPARCKLGLHTLVPSEFRAVVQDGEVHISCPACAADGADHYWRLTTSRPLPIVPSWTRRPIATSSSIERGRHRRWRVAKVINSPFTTWEGDALHGRRPVHTSVSGYAWTTSPLVQLISLIRHRDRLGRGRSGSRSTPRPFSQLDRWGCRRRASPGQR